MPLIRSKYCSHCNTLGGIEEIIYPEGREQCCLFCGRAVPNLIPILPRKGRGKDRSPRLRRYGKNMSAP